MAKTSSFDIVVYGATGFSGRFVTEYLAERSKSVPGLRWAIAGRSRDKLEKVRAETGAMDAGIIVADASDQASLDAMVASAGVILTTVGPYSVYGSPLVEACARLGTDYVDLTGEPNWMRQMIDAHEATARKSGARILFACGFDSIPSELGVFFVQKLAKQRFGKPMPRVRGRVVTFIGGPGGGSIATGMAMAKATSEDPAYAQLMQDPFALTPGFRGPEQPKGHETGVEEDVGPVRPFMLGFTDAKNVHRSNFLMNHPYGKDFVYDEMELGVPQQGGPPWAGKMPKPGEGPGPDVIANGRFEILFIGTNASGQKVRARLACSREPGFFATARMITETALSLVADRDVAPGFWTPGAAFQDKLIERLTQHAYMTFAAVDD